MHALVRHFFGFFLHIGAFGLVLLGILDSSFLFLPFGNDLLLVILVARHHAYLPLYVVAASLGSATGVLLLDLACRKGGEEGLKKMMSGKRINYLKKKMSQHAAVPLIATCLRATAVSIHCGHRRRERIPVPQAAPARLCLRRPRCPVHSHRAGRHLVRPPNSPNCELARIHLVHGRILGVVHRWKHAIDPALDSFEPITIGKTLGGLRSETTTRCHELCVAETQGCGRSPTLTRRQDTVFAQTYASYWATAMVTPF